MQSCWSYEPDERPTFRYCLEVLQKLKECTNDKIRIQARNLNKSDGKDLYLFNLTLLEYHFASHFI